MNITGDDATPQGGKTQSKTQTLPLPKHPPAALQKAEGINQLVSDLDIKLKEIADATGINTKDVADELCERLGAPPKPRATGADKLIALAIKKGITLICDKSGEAYATVSVNGHLENWKVRSAGFKRWLRGIWYEEHSKGIAGNFIDEALDTLEAKAVHEGQRCEVYIRVAHKDGAIYIDLCDDAWQCVKISSEGVSIVQDAPVKFVRAFGMLPLPEPVIGGNAINKLGKLRDLLNVSDITWKRIVAWILSTYSEGPYWILILTGEQGTAKSFATRLIRLTVDPSLFELLTAPKEQRDVIFSAVNGHVLAIDNLSGIPAWLSDLLCGVATGTATRMRAYHTNDGTEVAFIAKRPTVLNGIDLAVRDDLTSRSLLGPLSPITSQKDEKELRKQFESILPEVLGGIFEILVDVLKNLPNTKTPAIRMADAGKWVTAAEKALGWTEGEFLRVYEGSRNETVELAIESDIFGTALIELLQKHPNWTGTWKELSNVLLMEGEHYAQPRNWPTTGKAIAGRLRRLAPALRHPHYGYQYECKRAGNRRWYEFSLVEEAAQVTLLPQVTSPSSCKAVSSDTYDSNDASDDDLDV